MTRIYRPVLLFLTWCLFFPSLCCASDYNAAEAQSLLEYAHGCLIAQLNGTALPDAPDFALREQRPCFVTFFHKKNVFACFGGFSARQTNLAEEIANHVRLALANDNRARNVTAEMAKNAGVQITFPCFPERIRHYREIDPSREGMFVENDNDGVAFVPGEARTSSWAFRQALIRLGETNHAAVTVYRFQSFFISTRHELRK